MVVHPFSYFSIRVLPPSWAVQFIILVNSMQDSYTFLRQRNDPGLSASPVRLPFLDVVWCNLPEVFFAALLVSDDDLEFVFISDF